MTTFNQFLGAELLTEGRFDGSRGSPILPAGRVLFGKNKVTPNHAASKEGGVWGSGDQSIETYEHVGKEGHFHVSTASKHDPNSKYSPKLGAVKDFSHDQSGNRMPSGKLVGVSVYKDGKKVEHHGEDHSETKAPFHVYK